MSLEQQWRWQLERWISLVRLIAVPWALIEVVFLIDFSSSAWLGAGTAAEGIEELGRHLRRDGRHRVIRHGQGDPAVLRLGELHGDGPARGAVVDGVLHQVLDHLREPAHVP